MGRGDQPENLAAGEAERHGPHHAGHNTEIVELSDRPIDTEPMYTGAGVEVDDLPAALGFRFGELAVESQGSLDRSGCRLFNRGSGSARSDTGIRCAARICPPGSTLSTM